MTEKQAWMKLRDSIGRSGRFDRIESKVIAGMPDVNYCVDGIEGWIEIKCPYESNNPDERLFTKSKHQLSMAQRNWFLKQRKAGGIGWVLIVTNKRWLLIDGCKYGEQISRMTVKELFHTSSWTMNAKSTNQWDGLMQVLKMEMTFVPLWISDETHGEERSGLL